MAIFTATASLSPRGWRRSPSRRDFCLGHRARPDPGSSIAPSKASASRAKEHGPSGSRLSGQFQNPLPNPPRYAGEESAQSARVGRNRHIAAARQAVVRGAAPRQSKRQSGAGIFRRRHGRGDHHALSRIRWLFIARNSTSPTKARR
jgi:hypothetical protein